VHDKIDSMRCERIREATENNRHLLDAIDEIDFSSRTAITNEIFRRMVEQKIAFGWADLKIAFENGVVPVTLKKFLGDEEAAREIWDAAKLAYTQRMNDLADYTLEWVMRYGKDENAKTKAAQFVKERRDPDYARKDVEADAPCGGRVLIAQQIVVRITDKAGAKKRAEIEGAVVDQAEIGFEPAVTLDAFDPERVALAAGMLEAPAEADQESAA
jgi:hypothetical protein